MFGVLNEFPFDFKNIMLPEWQSQQKWLVLEIWHTLVFNNGPDLGLMSEKMVMWRGG
jgi:hypothetical protein